MSDLLRTSYSLNLAAADAMANAAIEAVADLEVYKPMAVTVLDSAGGVLVQKRMDGCPDGAYVKFSYAKARTCIHLQTSSRTFREKYTGGGEAPKFTQAAAMVTLMKDELVPVAGGVLIKAEDGSIVGSIGVSGAAAAEDEYLAWKGVQAINDAGFFSTIPATHSCTTLKEYC
mmetsp:Transcript_22622/g.56037  ORF Transcript_22622/g.56037 Transcript_22622/m.56037 type:complete len:173 (+) Transcript_22622:1061-1579(+)|eukprot:CAMPEP_0116084182 /NCGR_PEP_ID=MMETSP0327-20121206/3669_1 /TAXON_ID=44447 /ORGANISM="Pseudo-nitzschia delicatissima, Strain B596" /LENGTH=172 /DNA_ID=CAMNT_0003575117 /DNA_START=1043 /DNA_END=1561 /DNA_ORIENTATION=+